MLPDVNVAAMTAAAVTGSAAAEFASRVNAGGGQPERAAGS